MNMRSRKEGIILGLFLAIFSLITAVVLFFYHSIMGLCAIGASSVLVIWAFICVSEKTPPLVGGG